MRKLFRLENIESCWDFMEYNSIQSFVELFCNETLTRVYRLIIFSSELQQDRFFCMNLKKLSREKQLKENLIVFSL